MAALAQSYSSEFMEEQHLRTNQLGLLYMYQRCIRNPFPLVLGVLLLPTNMDLCIFILEKLTQPYGPRV